MSRNELRNLDFASSGKRVSEKVESDQEQIERLEQENRDLRIDIDDLQTICKYLEGRVTKLTELLYESNKYIKENRL